ncbi:MAG: MFS transporter, partial [Anaerolineae bacterium]|nr:MFS transporter [Anaerolineae bacterium]
SPLVAGSLYMLPGVGLRGILFIDFATFAFSTLTLIIAPIPPYKRQDNPDDTPRTVWRDIRVGWQYIAQYPGLLWLLGTFAALNFLGDFIYPLAQPLLFETTSPARAGTAMSIMAVGMFVGIAIMTFWGGPQRRIHGILIPAILSGLAIACAGLRPSLPLIIVAGFTYFALLPILQGSDRALWQTKVAQDVQGRVFAMQSVITSALSPLALLLTGPLTDHVFEPALRPNGALADSVGRVIGTGPGRGMAFFIIIVGLLSALVALIAYLHPRIRLLEDELPDADLPETSLIAETT